MNTFSFLKILSEYCTLFRIIIYESCNTFLNLLLLLLSLYRCLVFIFVYCSHLHPCMHYCVLTSCVPPGYCVRQKPGRSLSTGHGVLHAITRWRWDQLGTVSIVKGSGNNELENVGVLYSIWEGEEDVTQTSLIPRPFVQHVYHFQYNMCNTNHAGGGWDCCISAIKPPPLNNIRTSRRAERNKRCPCLVAAASIRIAC